MISNIQPGSSEENNIIVNMKLYDQIDTVWMLSHAHGLPNIPMWVGFNSEIMKDDSPQQFIFYLTPINASPTNNAVVLETMQQSMTILEELNQPYMQVTYDLAIARIALKIQSTEINRFSKLFIHLGEFHVMLSYFKAIGKIINDCGLSIIMVESEMLASGSVSGFMDGKHFNRCKRLHPIVALGPHILHFRSFLARQNIQITKHIQEELERYNAKKCKDVDDGRFQLFVSSYKASDVDESFSKRVRSFDASSIPPSKSEPYQHLLRTHYISSIWKNASEKNPTTLDPLQYGWLKQESSFAFKWFEENQLPCTVGDLIEKLPETEAIDDDHVSPEDENDSEDDIHE